MKAFATTSAKQKWPALLVCAATLAATSVVAGDGQQPPATPSYPKMAPVEQYLMARDAEIALARSAAPPSIAKDATALVLTRKGYETGIEGTNGFVCLVERSWQSSFDDPEFWNPKERGPACLNAPAARSVLPSELKMAMLALSGLTKDVILGRVKESIAKKEFVGPEIGAMSYMLSKDQFLNDQGGHWHPHLMFYMPGEMNPSVWGANLPSGSAIYGGGKDLPGGGRMPWTIFVVPVARWSDGTPAMSDAPGR